MLFHDIYRDGSLVVNCRSETVPFPTACHLVFFAVYDVALYSCLSLLWHDGIVYCKVSRECYANSGIYVSSIIVPYRCVLASDKHSRVLAGCIMAFPIYFWSQSIYSVELNGSKCQ